MFAPRVLDLLVPEHGERAADPPVRPTEDDPLRRDKKLNDLVPDNPNRPYDMKEIIQAVVDES